MVDSEVSYDSVGVNYEVLDAGKRQSIAAALLTSTLAQVRGASAIDDSRGEPAFLLRLGDTHLALVLECLGTKSTIARQYQELTGIDRFDWVGEDTVAAIVNDLCCVGALPLVLNAYFATGSADWYRVPNRHASLVRGWRQGCERAGAIWGGGESPTLSGIVAADEIDLAGCGLGKVPDGRLPFSGGRLQIGDEIVLVASTGLHTNGATLARRAAAVGGGLDVRLAGGETVGDALLTPSAIYVALVEELFRNSVDVVYASHVTGHGLRKLMRANRELTYRIRALPKVPAVFDFIISTLRLSAAEAYATFNMGSGFAIYCRSGQSTAVIAAAERTGFSALLAGQVEEGRRQVILEPLGLTFGGEDLQLR